MSVAARNIQEKPLGQSPAGQGADIIDLTSMLPDAAAVEKTEQETIDLVNSIMTDFVTNNAWLRFEDQTPAQISYRLSEAFCKAAESKIINFDHLKAFIRASLIDGCMPDTGFRFAEKLAACEAAGKFIDGTKMAQNESGEWVEVPRMDRDFDPSLLSDQRIALLNAYKALIGQPKPKIG